MKSVLLMLNNMNFIIRRMREEDTDQVYSLGFVAQEFRFNQEASFWTRDRLRSWCKSPEDLLLVAESDNEIAGFSLYACHRPTGKVTWENLYVSEKYRKNGVGQELILKGISMLREMGYSYIVLQNHNDDQERFARYLKKFGFKRGPMVMWMDQSFN